MQLSVKERILLLNLLPKEGNFTNLKLLRVAREALSFTELETKALNFRQEGDQMFWDVTADGLVDIPIGEVVTLLIITELKKLDADNKLQEQHLSLFEKFVDK